MRAKKVFEKFTEDSDPIHDMGIGLYNRAFDNMDDFIKFVLKIIPIITNTETIPDNVLTYAMDEGGKIPYWLFYSICIILTNYKTKWFGQTRNFISGGASGWPIYLLETLQSIGYEIRQEYGVKMEPLHGLHYYSVPTSIWKSPIQIELKKLGMFKKGRINEIS